MDEISTPDASADNLNILQRLKMHPTGFWYVFWGELAERASFYGMRTILALYLVTVLLYQKHEGAAIMQFFIAACYAAPLFGGWIADRHLGKYKTILYFSFPYVLGHLILGGIQTRPAMFLALAFLALGSGSIKPNTSTLMGQ
ncbi:MAG TPA: MFS transporter, partial [Elusimicrobiota bacterium]|nr:MFS transporter [Elusimicrobiota bacterium]